MTVSAMLRSIIFVSATLLVTFCSVPDRDAPSHGSAQSDSILNRQADSLYVLGIQLAKLGDTDNALAIHDRALDLRLARKVSDVRLAYSYWKTGRLLHLQLKVEAANPRLERAISLAEEFAAPVDSLVRIYLNASAIKGEVHDHASAISLGTYVERLVRTKYPEKKALYASCVMNLAAVNSKAGLYDQSAAMYRTYLRLLDKSQTRMIATTYFNLAMNNWNQERYDSCLFYLERTLMIRKKEEPSSAGIANIYLNKGDIFRRLGRIDSAYFYFR
jgi:tetratricopeptide (TPR) repeat protein